jgi:hypothetical protein
VRCGSVELPGDSRTRGIDGTVYGTLGGVTHAEPFVQKEVVAMGDVNAILLKSNGTDLDAGIRTASR